MARPHHFRTWDDYFIPGTNVLRNKYTAPGKPYGEPDPVKLRTMEEAETALRMGELSSRPIDGRFDYDHMKAIHRYIFGNVYEWAGQERVAPTTGFMVKDGHSYYPAGDELTRAAHAQYARLAEQDFLKGLDHEPFVAALAEVWGELNVIHSFREGNTRSQFVFFAQLIRQAGHQLNVRGFAPGSPLRNEFVAARFHSQDTGSNARLADVLGRAITTRTVSLNQTRSTVARRIDKATRAIENRQSRRPRQQRRPEGYSR